MDNDDEMYLMNGPAESPEVQGRTPPTWTTSPLETWGSAQPAPPIPPPMRRPPQQYQPMEAGWWLGADGLWYPPEQQPGPSATAASQSPASGQVVVNVNNAPMGFGAAPGYVTGASKSKVVAGLLAIFLGALGVHRFYTGHTGIGLAQLLITVLSFGFLALPVAIWAFIEGIMYLTGGIPADAQGRPLT